MLGGKGAEILGARTGDRFGAGYVIQPIVHGSDALPEDHKVSFLGGGLFNERLQHPTVIKS